MHDLPLITTIAAAFTSAWLLGLLTQRLGLSPIVGYLSAGILIGPYTPGFVGDTHIAQQLAEVGVILLMFGVGIHFHLKDLLAVKSVAIPGAVGQSVMATLFGVAIFTLFGLPVMVAAVLGMAMAVASTVVLMRVLMDADQLGSSQGHVAVGWLIVEDIFTVVVLVLIPVLAKGEASPDGAAPPSLGVSLGMALLKLSVLVAIVMFGGSRIIPWLLVRVARLRSRELFTLTVLVFSIAIATGSYLFFGASMALGAFLAGMVVAQSPVSHQAAADALPMRDAFAVIFFVSVGMLFDPAFIIREPLMILAALGIILIVKPLAALAIIALLGHSVRTGLTVALGLAQIGEFSFILSELAAKHGMMSSEGHNVLVAGAIISITLNPVLFRMLPRIETWLRGRPKLWKLLNGRADRRALTANSAAREQVEKQLESNGRLAVVVGFGPVGRTVHRLLRDAGVATVVIDMNMDTVSELSKQGQPAIFGDASHEAILEQAGMGRAAYLVLTLPHSADRIAVVTTARTINPDARILVRARYLGEREDLEQAGATAAVFEEGEAAVALARLVLADTGEQREVVERKVRDLRLELILENMSTIRSQRVRTIMVPWSRVERLSAGASRQEVLQQIAAHRFSRWPVTETRQGTVIGYLLAKDLIAAKEDEDWTRLVRPLHVVRSDDDIQSTLERMQGEAATMCIVEQSGVPVGLVTLEDILEQVVGRIEDEYPHERPVSLAESLGAGSMLLNLEGGTPEQVIAELAAAIPSHRLPADADIKALATARENQVSTDLGNGVAVPHARCPNLAAPVVVFGRSAEGVIFSPNAPELVRIVFLLVTPAEQPDLQLSLLGQVARIVKQPEARDRLIAASSEVEVMEVVSEVRESSEVRSA